MLQYHHKSFKSWGHESILMVHSFYFQHKSQQPLFLFHHEQINHVANIVEHLIHFILNTQQQFFHVYFNKKDFLNCILVLFLFQLIKWHSCLHLHLLLVYPNNYLHLFYFILRNPLHKTFNLYNNILQLDHVSILHLVL